MRMKVVNLFILSLICIVSNAQQDSWVNTKSRLEIILLHWDNEDVNGSYVKVKNNPYYDSKYNVTIDAEAEDKKRSKSYQLIASHQELGVGAIPIRWPEDMIGTKVNITVIEVPTVGEMLPESLRVKVLAHRMESASNKSGVYYPQGYQNAKISMIKLEDGWYPVWDHSSEIWLVNESNPQMLLPVEITPPSTKLLCFVCKAGLTSELFNYSIDLHSVSGAYSHSLLGFAADNQGFIVLPHNLTTEKINYTLWLHTNHSGTIQSHVVLSGLVKDIPRALPKEYNNKFVDEPLWNDVYINEIHFPRLNTTIEDDQKYWVEIIGPASTDLSKYCLAISSYTPSDGKTENSACIRPPTEGGINSKGYYLWDIEASKDAMSEYLLKMNTTRYAIQLYREHQVSYVLLDKFQFILIENMEGRNMAGGSCVGSSVDGHSCFKTPTADCNTLCLIKKSVLGSRATGVSRCGIQKDPQLKEKGAEMSVWSVESITRKAWNKCSRPNGYLKKIDIANSVVTISSAADSDPSFATLVNRAEAGAHLPNLGLMLMFFHKQTYKTEIGRLPLNGADLTFSSSVSTNYPLRNIEVTLQKTGKPDSSRSTEGQVNATGATLSSRSINNVYALALVQYYSFLPPLNISTMKDQVVDAVVYSLAATKLDIDVVTQFMDMRKGAGDQGQIRFSRSAKPVLLHKDLTIERDTGSWVGINSEGKEYELDKIYVTQSAQKYIRITRVGNNENPYVELTLQGLPKKLSQVFPSGVPLTGLCLVVREYAAAQSVSRVLASNYTATDDITLTTGSTVRMTLRKVSNKPYFANGENFLTLFREINLADVCMQEFDIYETPIDGSDPSSNGEVLIDYMKISYNVDSSGDDSVPLTDGQEAARCNSDKPYYNAAFTVVNPSSQCPVPNHLYIYKLCHDRIGIASELEHILPMPTDYLYIYQLNSENKITYIVRGKYPILKYKYNMAFNGTANITNTAITSFGLGWFPTSVPRIGDKVLNNTLSVIVFYPDQKLKADADTRLTSILETAVDHEKASRPVVYYKPSTNDLRHCLLGCSRTSNLNDVISYKLDAFGNNDDPCKVDFTSQYEGIRINEINTNTVGFKDAGEYVELKGEANFEYAAGLTMVILEVEHGKVEYKYIYPVTGAGKVFDENGFFIFEYNVTGPQKSSQKIDHMRFIPNVVGAVALLWGAELVPEIKRAAEVTDEHVRMRDLFLDVVIYANGMVSAHSTDVTTLTSKFAMGDTKSIKGKVAIEKARTSNSTETISRCFCNDTWNMDCFEMSFTETKRQENSCPTAFSKELTLCLNVTESMIIKRFDALRESIRDMVWNSEGCQASSCLFSKYQVRAWDHCAVRSSLQKWSFTVGFPTQLNFDTLEQEITVDKLMKEKPELQIVACGDATCPVSPANHMVPTSTEAPKSKTHVVIYAVVASVLILIIVVVVSFIVIRRRRKRLKDMSARFEANFEDGEDDDNGTFIPDGRISFSNPRYNPSNGSSIGNSKQEYQQLSQT